MVTCQYCGTLNTVSAAGETYNRANYLRRNNEFDKAITAYEGVLVQDNTEHEARWGIVLSRYGIEYVEEPASGERISMAFPSYKCLFDTNTTEN